MDKQYLGKYYESLIEEDKCIREMVRDEMIQVYDSYERIKMIKMITDDIKRYVNGEDFNIPENTRPRRKIRIELPNG